MSTYQGPNASVTQQFVTSPGAIAIEDLPSVAVASAYDVFKKESIGSSFGVKDESVSFGVDKVIYNRSQAGSKAFDMYPPKAYANSIFGNIDLDLPQSDITSSGFSIDKDYSYVVPNTAKAAGSCRGIIPYYSAIKTTVILATDLSTIVITNGAVVTAQVKPGMRILINSTGSGWLDVGSVGSIGNDETKIYLSTPYSGAITDGVQIIVGAANTTLKTIPNILFDETADFVSAKVAIGDIISFSSLAISGSVVTPKTASVTAIINKNTLRFNTEALDAGRVDYDFSKYIAFTNVVGTTVQLYSYSVKRFVGFSKNLGLKTLDSGSGVSIVEVFGDAASPTSFSVTSSLVASTGMQKGDIIAITPSNVSDSSEERSVANLRLYRIDTITHGDSTVTSASASRSPSASQSISPSSSESPSSSQSNSPSSSESPSSSLSGSPSSSISPSASASASPGPGFETGVFIITVSTPIYRSVSSSSTDPIVAGDHLNAWTPKIESEIVADFRAVRSEEQHVVKRITSTKDIYTAWVRSGEDTIDPRNELAFMMSIIFNLSGGKVCYGVNVDSTAANKTSEYSEALEELKLVDVYSHSFGTTDSGVNGVVGAYCDEQSAPYEAHERIGSICYDLDDLYLMGSDSASSINISTGEIVTGGSFSLLTAGVTVNDIANIFDSDGELVATATVVETPTVYNKVITDYRGTLTSAPVVKFESGRKEDQAVRVGNIKYGNRRVSVIFPGWFQADFNGERMSLPPYFITAALVGLDSGVKASQPFTNMPFSIPGLSNIQLDTNTYFRKSNLDTIGGGGVDIMIQDATITQSIKSRHDLTSNMDAVQYRERSITKQADVAAKTIRNAVKPYVGRYNINDPNLFRFLGQVCSVVCGKVVKDGVLSKLVVTKIARDEVIDDKINLFMEATAFIAGNYYDITLLVKTR